jgi:hypothetical protein
VLSRLKLLRRLQEVDIESLDEGLELLERVKTNTSSAEDRERLARLIRATTAVTDQLRAASFDAEPSSPRRPSPERRAKRKRQLAKAARRRQRRYSLTG